MYRRRPALLCGSKLKLMGFPSLRGVAVLGFLRTVTVAGPARCLAGALGGCYADGCPRSVGRVWLGSYHRSVTSLPLRKA